MGSSGYFIKLLLQRVAFASVFHGALYKTMPQQPFSDRLESEAPHLLGSAFTGSPSF
jgi:hypothetical protein